jgi:hypothetical protein
MWLGFSLWGGDLSNLDATAVGLGTVASFLLSGGPVQAMARRGLFFSTTQQDAQCAQAIWRWTRVGAVVVCSGAGAFLAASEYWNWLPPSVNLTAAAFSVGLGLFWLGAGALTTLGRGMHLFWIYLAGIGLVAILHYLLKWPLLAAQLTAILACGIFALLVVASILKTISLRGWPAVLEVYLLWPCITFGVLF